jgi:hypothetical protein
VSTEELGQLGVLSREDIRCFQLKLTSCFSPGKRTDRHKQFRYCLMAPSVAVRNFVRAKLIVKDKTTEKHCHETPQF